ncbi:integrase, catalytic region, zinc finger, CCHC-type containing protein, partial [Tanacetum coccineum]
LPPDVYALVNNHKIAKDIWDKVKLLMQGTSLSRQERERKLYDKFDKFSHVKGETLYQYYLRFAQLINDMKAIQMTMQPIQVNTKFLNSLPPEWGKFVTNVKLARDLHTSKYDQLYAYLKQHETHANEARLMCERFPDLLSNPYGAPHHPQQYPFTYLTNLNHTQPSVPQNAYSPSTIPQQPQAEFPQIDSGLAVPTFLPSDDPIACMNKAMAFLSAVFTPRYPSTNNQLRSSTNPRNQATVQDGRVIVQQVQGREGQNVVGSGLQRNASSSKGNTSGQVKVIKCYNCQREGHMARQYPRVADGQVAQTITHNAVFQTDDLDVYDSDCDDISSAKAVLMANLSSCDSDVLSEDKANNESKIVNESLTAELERYKEGVKILEQRFNVDLSGREKFIDSQMDDMIRMKNTKFAAFETEIDTLKHALSKHVKEKESLLTTLNDFKTEFKERESKSIDKEIIKPILYDGNVLSKTHDVLSVVDDEETLILAEESR